MNAPIASKRLVAAAAELVERVPFFPDETTFSYVNRITCLTAAISRRQVVEMLFGSRTICTHRPLHSGFGHLAALHADPYGVTPDDLPQRYGLLALYAPFLDSERYRRVIRLAHRSHGGGLNEVAGYRKIGVFRETPAFCPRCVENDLASHRAPYYRRSHQVSAVLCCPEHGVPLIEACCSCREAAAFERLPKFNCPHCETPYGEAAAMLGPISQGDLGWRLAKFVQAAMLGYLPKVDAGIRIAVLRERAARRLKNRGGALEDNLARTITKAYKRPFLAKLGLQTDAAPTLAWPSLLISGRLFVSEPIANCLVMATLFDSVGDYTREINIAVGCGRSHPLGRNLLCGYAEITNAVLKDLMRPNRIERVANKHSINPTSLKNWVAAVPGLSKRRQASWPRIALRKCKKTILCHIAQNPGQSRNRVATEHKAEVTFIFKKDREWLDQYLPAQQNQSRAVCRPDG